VSEKKMKVGEKAPDFSLPSSDGKKISLKDFRGKKPVVLCFYPKDDTPGCTTEACGFRDLYAEIGKSNAVVLGVSLDPLEAHKKFIDKYNLPFPLLSDEEAKVSKAYGVYGEKNMYGKKFWGIHRTTFLINQEGIIEEIYHKVKVETHPREVLTCLENLS
jgi:peroxiredoxin Q/BCP